MDDGIATIQRSSGRLSANSPGNIVRYDALPILTVKYFV